MSHGTLVLTKRRICVIGLGNVLLGDDAFGPMVIETFRREYACGPNVEVLEVGTPGLEFAPYLYDSDVALIADAVNSDGKAGTLLVYRESELFGQCANVRVSGHDPGIGQCLTQLKLAGHAPSDVAILGVIPQCCDLGCGMSAPVLAAIPAGAEAIACWIREHGAACVRRTVSDCCRLWWEAIPCDSSILV